jgi:hypothetical protein
VSSPGLVLAALRAMDAEKDHLEPPQKKLKKNIKIPLISLKIVDTTNKYRYNWFVGATNY